MPNPLFGGFGPQNQNGSIVDKFNQFRANFQGDPRERVQELLNSGQMTQDQFNRLAQLAQQFQSFLHR